MATYELENVSEVGVSDEFEASTPFSEYSDLSIVLNTETFAPSQYGGISFDSLCTFNDRIIGANESGIFEHGGDTINNEAIEAKFRTFSTDLGVDNEKEIRMMTVSGLTEGGLALTPYFDDVRSEERVIEYFGEQAQLSITLGFSSAYKGRYIGIEVANVDGADFAIDAIELLFSLVSGPHRSEKATRGRLNQAYPFEISATGTVA